MRGRSALAVVLAGLGLGVPARAEAGAARVDGGVAAAPERLDPAGTVAHLATKVGRTDARLSRAVDHVASLVAAGRARDAARLAQAVATRLNATDAAALLGLPRLLLAERRLERARLALAQEDPVGARLALEEARALSSELTQQSGLEARVVELRAALLAARARALAGVDASMAAAYFLA